MLRAASEADRRDHDGKEDDDNSNRAANRTHCSMMRRASLLGTFTEVSQEPLGRIIISVADEEAELQIHCPRSHSWEGGVSIAQGK